MQHYRRCEMLENSNEHVSLMSLIQFSLENVWVWVDGIGEHEAVRPGDLNVYRSINKLMPRCWANDQTKIFVPLMESAHERSGRMELVHIALWFLVKGTRNRLGLYLTQILDESGADTAYIVGKWAQRYTCVECMTDGCDRLVSISSTLNHSADTLCYCSSQCQLKDSHTHETGHLTDTKEHRLLLAQMLDYTLLPIIYESGRAATLKSDHLQHIRDRPHSALFVFDPTTKQFVPILDARIYLLGTNIAYRTVWFESKTDKSLSLLITTIEAGSFNYAATRFKTDYGIEEPKDHDLLNSMTESPTPYKTVRAFIEAHALKHPTTTCQACGQICSTLLRCSACWKAKVQPRRVVYCSKACQRDNWGTHKQTCAAAQK